MPNIEQFLTERTLSAVFMPGTLSAVNAEVSRILQAASRGCVMHSEETAGSQIQTEHVGHIELPRNHKH